MTEYTFIDWVGKTHFIMASEVGAAFQFADENLRQGIPFKYYWVECGPLTYKLGASK